MHTVSVSRAVGRFPPAPARVEAIIEALERRALLSGDGVASAAPPAAVRGDARTDVRADATAKEMRVVSTADGKAVATAEGDVRIDRPLRVFSWHDWDIDGVTPMIWAEMDRLTPQQAAAATIPQLKAQPEGERAVFLWELGLHPEHRWIPQRGAHDVDFPAFLRQGGFATDRDEAWIETYFTLLKRSGVTPDYVVLDYEEGVSHWGLDQAKIDRFLQSTRTNPGAWQLLPPELRAIDPDDLNRTNGEMKWRESTTQWHYWAEVERQAALRRAVVGPLARVFGDGKTNPIAVSNYGDIATNHLVPDFNWGIRPKGMDVTTDGISSPDLYAQTFGQRYGNAPDPLWQRFVDAMTAARSAIDAGSTLVPWVSYPSYVSTNGEPADRHWVETRVHPLWEEQMYQLRAAGVETFLLWWPDSRWSGLTPQQEQVEREIVRRTVANMKTQPVLQVDGLLGRTRFGDDVVSTAGRVVDRHSYVGRFEPVVTDAARLLREDVGTPATPDVSEPGARPTPRPVPEPRVVPDDAPVPHDDAPVPHRDAPAAPQARAAAPAEARLATSVTEVLAGTWSWTRFQRDGGTTGTGWVRLQTLSADLFESAEDREDRERRVLG